MLDGLHPRGARASWQSPPVLQGESCCDFLCICFIWQTRNVAEQGETPCLDNDREGSLLGCPSYIIIPDTVVPFDSQQLTQTPLVESIILSASLLVTALHSELCRKIGRMQVLYRFSLVETEIRNFQIWLSRFCIAAWVMALRREISEELWVVEWIREPR